MLCALYCRHDKVQITHMIESCVRKALVTLV